MRKNSADTRDASPRRSIVSSSVIASSEFATTRYASETIRFAVQSTWRSSNRAAAGATMASATVYWTRFAVTGCCSAPKRFSYSVPTVSAARAASVQISAPAGIASTLGAR